MGGFGSFGAVALSPQTFAAAIPICGGWAPGDAAKMKDVALWVFHGDADGTVPVERSRSMVEALKQAGGSPKYTEFPGVGHNSWSKAYALPETWEWLFAQRRQST
jgi:predicted peptidase